MTMKTVLLAFVVMALLSPGLSARLERADVADYPDFGPRGTLLWLDDMESGINGWTTV